MLRFKSATKKEFQEKKVKNFKSSIKYLKLFSYYQRVIIIIYLFMTMIASTEDASNLWHFLKKNLATIEVLGEGLRLS